jgi:hypothetical protein
MGVADPDTGTGRKTLQIHSANDYSYLVLTNNTTGSTASSDGTSLLTCQNNFTILNRESGNINLATSGTDRLIINSAGNVGIGCSPGVNLDVESSASETYARIKNTSASGQAILILNNDVGNWQVKCDTDDSFRIRDNGNASDRLKIDSSGRVTMPNLPAFRAWDETHNTFTFNTPFAFSSTHFNNGSHYNTSNGRFTAPVAGYYTFSTCFGTSGWSSGNTTQDLFTIRHNNSAICYSIKRENTDSANSNNGFFTDYGNIIVYLAVNDYVTVVPAYNMNNFKNKNYTWFCGALLG